MLLESYQKIISKTDVKEVIPYIFFWEFYSFGSYVQVFNALLCKLRVQFRSYACGYAVFQTLFIEETVPFSMVFVEPLLKTG